MVQAIILIYPFSWSNVLKIISEILACLWVGVGSLSIIRARVHRLQADKVGSVFVGVTLVVFGFILMYSCYMHVK